jgi:hypothetical protein
MSWGAVWAGVLIALGMEVLFTAFGFFVGFGMYHWDAANPWAGVSAWSTIWYFITIGWSMFFGAWCAARLSSNPIPGDGILHGITTWGFATTATMFVVALASWALFKEGIGVLSMAVITAAQTTPAVIAPVPGNSGPMAQATAHVISVLSLRIFIGVIIAFVTALIGGLVGRSRTVVVAPPDVVPVPTRRAA